MQTTPDILYWVAANHLVGIGPVKLQRWIQQLGSIENIFTASKAELVSLALTPTQIHAIEKVDWKAAHKDLTWCDKNHCHIISWEDKRYPMLLKEAPGSPILLFVKGNPDLLKEPQLAVVGSRNPTHLGRKLAEQFAYALSQDLIITSGLAIGIDAASHRGALKATGKTIAVCGGGLEYIYPAANTSLAEEILQKGAIISEFSPFTQPKAGYFPRRNRIISGLSLGVLVVEAALRSGSLITAQFAIDQGREVFAIPGSIHNPLARGCHQLIRQGAKLVETEKDILEELKSLKSLFKNPKVIDPVVPQNASQANLLNQIGYETTSFDAIIKRSGLTTNEVSSMLLSLELEGYVQFQAGGYIRNG